MADFEAVARRVASIGKVRTAGKIEFVKDQGPVRRDVRVKGYKWSSDALRDLAKILWAGQRAHSYAMAAFRIFSKMPSSEFSPDGLLGGRGYIQSIKDMRSGLSNAVEVLSTFTDTIHDEVNADHWNPVEKEAEIDDIVADAGAVKENPETFVEGQFEKGGEEDPLVNPMAENPEVSEDEDQDDQDDEDPGSQLPPDVPRTSSDVLYDRYSIAFDNMLRARVASSRMSGGALDELLVPGMEPTITDRDLGGPRAFPLGPAEGGEFGNFEDPECPSNLDDTSMEEQELLLDNGLFLPSLLQGGDGDDFRLSRTSANLPESYSWLPGSDNCKSMNWYGLGVTEADMEWMKANSKPNMPMGILPETEDSDSESLWDGIRIR
jgi:hypothetical protein